MSRTEETSVGCVVGICSLVSQGCRFLRILLSFLSGNSSTNRDHNHQNSAWSCIFEHNQLSTTSRHRWIQELEYTEALHDYAFIKPNQDGLCWFSELILRGFVNIETQKIDMRKKARTIEKTRNSFITNYCSFTLSNSLYIFKDSYIKIGQ